MCFSDLEVFEFLLFLEGCDCGGLIGKFLTCEEEGDGVFAKVSINWDGGGLVGRVFNNWGEGIDSLEAFFNNAVGGGSFGKDFII